MKRALILVLFVLALRGSVFAEHAIQEFTFNGERAKQYVAYLSSDAMEGRMSGTEGYRKAADWVASKFKAWGLQPAGENGTYFQKVTIPPFVWQTGVPSLKVGSRDFPFDDGDYALHPVSTTGTRLKREIVFVGYGIAAAEKGLDEYAGVDVQDRIVLALKGSPKNAPPVRGFFERPETTKKEEAGDDWQAESTDWQKITTAYDLHARRQTFRDQRLDDLFTVRVIRKCRDDDTIFFIHVGIHRINKTIQVAFRFEKRNLFAERKATM